jgi:hypothetical protein
MRVNVGKEVAAMQRMSVTELREKYAEAFGEATNANNKGWLVKRIAWRLQAMTEGSLSERARKRAAELANDADVRLTPPKAKVAPVSKGGTTTTPLRFKGDSRLPPTGTILTRTYKGETLRVTVLADGFEFEGEYYKSLSAIAKSVTGTHCNGFHFFQLGRRTNDE